MSLIEQNTHLIQYIKSRYRSCDHHVTYVMSRLTVTRVTSHIITDYYEELRC